MDYSVELYTLPYIRRPLQWNDLANFDRVKVLNITHNVILDDDCAGHFACMKSLIAFHISPSCTMYYEKDGVLYAKAKDCRTTCEAHWIEDLEDDDEVLIEVPPAYPGDSFIVPEGVKAIYNGAFEGTRFKKIVLPESLERVGFHALDRLRNLEVLCVPNKDVYIYDQLTYDNPISIECSNGGELDEDVSRKWSWWLNPIEKNVTLQEEEEIIGKDWLPLMTCYSRKFVYPIKEMEDVIASLTSKESILSNLESLEEKYPKYADFMRAMIFLHTDVTLLHCNSKDEANRVIKAIWGDGLSAKASVLKYVDLHCIDERETWSDELSRDEILDIAYSSFYFDEECRYSSEVLFEPDNNVNCELFTTAQLAMSAPMLFLDHLGNKFIRDRVLLPKAIETLIELADNGDDYAAMNLLTSKDEYDSIISEVEGFHEEKYTQMAILKGDIIALYDRCENYVHRRLNRATFEITEVQRNDVETFVEACLREDNFVETTYEWALSRIRKHVKNCREWVRLYFTVTAPVPQKVVSPTISPNKKTIVTANDKKVSETPRKVIRKKPNHEEESKQLDLFDVF